MATRALEPDFPCDSGPREWFTATELAELALPGLPSDKRSVNRFARENRWALRSGKDGQLLRRPRAARGGGMEFHISLLPGPARLELARRGITAGHPKPELVDPAAEAWRWFDVQSAKVKAEAERRLSIVREVELLQHSGLTRTAAVAEVSSEHGAGRATIWGWIGLVDGVAHHHRLPMLAPRRRGGGAEAEIDPFLWDVFKSDYLRPSAPTLAACHARTAAIATERGLSMPSERTMRRRLEREIPKALIIKRREGDEALRRSIPAQRRTVDHLHALQIVNIDGHKFDVRVTPPGGGDPVRPIMVALQDVYSSKVLSFCLDLSENALQTQIALAALFRDFGIPKVCLLDNGRAFASKKITGGAKTRFRFKIKAEEPTGILTSLGIETSWALPYRGQSKPVERAFRDMCDRISRHPATEGAYVGNSPLNKPHNYGTRAMDWDAFTAHVARGIAEHNARPGRKGRHYRGRSFDEVFAESYAAAPIGKATPEQLRVALLTAEQKQVNRQTSEIELFGNRYWSPACHEFAGQRVTVRFDAENLHSEIYLYDLEGRFLTSAELVEDNGFDTEAGARASAKRLSDFRKRVRAVEDAEQLLMAEQVAALQPELPAAQLPEPAVIRPVRHRGQTAAALKPAPQATEHQERQSKILGAISHLRAVE